MWDYVYIILRQINTSNAKVQCLPFILRFHGAQEESYSSSNVSDLLKKILLVGRQAKKEVSAER